MRSTLARTNAAQLFAGTEAVAEVGTFGAHAAHAADAADGPNADVMP
jgi:hypothetical protein